MIFSKQFQKGLQLNRFRVESGIIFVKITSQFMQCVLDYFFEALEKGKDLRNSCFENLISN